MRPITFFLFLLIGCAGIHGNMMSEATNVPAVTEAYPTKPVRLIEPFGVGGGPDLLARALAQQLSELWGQACDSREHPRGGSHGRPRTGREVTTRRLHVASHHQRSSIQRCLLKGSAI